ncbi:MAG TPA: hypothetical protein PLJ78_04100 [Anaerolineae bacterium]|nr:hypothetical protein [Anaerolineae bacterium]HQK13113.1 hypothetical protein [Anaerolineae bacterium]
MTKKSWFNYILFYVLWVLLMALGFWFLFLSREVFLTAAAYFAGDSVTAGWQVRFYDKVFFLAVGLGLLVFILVTENYLRAGIAKHTVWQRFAKIAGWTLLVIAVTDTALLILQQFTGFSWLRGLVIVADICLGAGFLWIGRRASKKPAASSSTTDSPDSF